MIDFLIRRGSQRHTNAQREQHVMREVDELPRGQEHQGGPGFNPWG